MSEKKKPAKKRSVCSCRSKSVRDNPDFYCYGCCQNVCTPCAIKWHQGRMDQNDPKRSHRQGWWTRVK